MQHEPYILRMPPVFDDRPPTFDATIWRVSLSAGKAFQLLCDIGHLYPSHELRPRVGAMLEYDGSLTLYVWPRADPDSQLLLLMLRYNNTTLLANMSAWHGQVWICGDLLGRVLAALTMRAHQQLLASEVSA